MLGGTVMEKIESTNNEIWVDESLLRALDKGINDLENERTVPHAQSMEMVRQRLTTCVQNYIKQCPIPVSH